MAHPLIYGLIGYPVKHSLSPAMHNAAFRALKINAEYRLFEVEPQELEDFLTRLNDKNIFGLNVTVPHKEKVLDFVKLDSEFFYLRQVKAINTIVRQGTIAKGFNTDIPGFSRHLKENFDPKGKKIALLGAGGAARAITYVLAKSNVREIYIFDIDSAKSSEVTKMIKKILPDTHIFAVDSIAGLNIRNKDMLINATPVGLKENDQCLVEKDMLHRKLFVYDLIYNPRETRLLALARKAGAKTSNGLGMLLYQGILSFERFTNQKAPVDLMKKALDEAIKKS